MALYHIKNDLENDDALIIWTLLIGLKVSIIIIQVPLYVYVCMCSAVHMV